MRLVSLSRIPGERFRVAHRADGGLCMLAGTREQRAPDDIDQFGTLEECIAFVRQLAEDAGEPYKILTCLLPEDSRRFDEAMRGIQDKFWKKEEAAV